MFLAATFEPDRAPIDQPVTTTLFASAACGRRSPIWLPARRAPSTVAGGRRTAVGRRRGPAQRVAMVCAVRRAPIVGSSGHHVRRATKSDRARSLRVERLIAATWNLTAVPVTRPVTTKLVGTGSAVVRRAPDPERQSRRPPRTGGPGDGGRWSALAGAKSTRTMAEASLRVFSGDSAVPSGWASPRTGESR